jgi:hypothetical protein
MAIPQRKSTPQKTKRLQRMANSRQSAEWKNVGDRVF